MPAAIRLLVLVNPAAGGGRAGRAAPAVRSYLARRGVAANFVESSSAADLRERAGAAAAQGYTAVAALGGDGTFHHVLNGALATGIPLAMIPAGHGNDLAAALDLPRDPIAAARIVARGHTRTIDILRARAADGAVVHIAGAAGSGLDAEAARLAQGRYHRLPGALRYLAAALTAWRDFSPLEIEVEADGHTLGARVLLAAVANGPCYGAGVRIAPAAQIDDGWMDVALVAPMRIGEAAELVLRALARGNIGPPAVVRLRSRRLRITTDRPAIFQADGEPAGAAPVEFEVLPAAARVLAPPSAG